ncbi:MAG: NAD(P)H-dependent oxidoreductase subunit E, partial [Acidobacteria bacterium]|nr:NAD(P)H-dependent oxidoreductase subunit E [Acidobacteriota bacterium]
MTFHPTIDYAAPHRSARKLAEPGDPFTFTPENRAELEEICTRYPPERRRSAILPALHIAQRQQGYITAAAMRHVAEVIGCTPADIEDVVSFYTMYYTEPVGRYVLQVCRTLSCALRGAG